MALILPPALPAFKFVDMMAAGKRGWELGTKQRRQPELERQQDAAFANRQAQEARRAEAAQYGRTQRPAAEAQRAATTANTESQTAQREADAQRRQDFNEALARCKANRSERCYQDLMAQFPKLGAAIGKSNEYYDTKQLEWRKSNINVVKTYLDAGEIDKAKTYLDTTIEAAKKSGKEVMGKESKQLLDMINTGPEGIEGASTLLGLTLADINKRQGKGRANVGRANAYDIDEYADGLIVKKNKRTGEITAKFNGNDVPTNQIGKYIKAGKASDIDEAIRQRSEIETFKVGTTGEKDVKKSGLKVAAAKTIDANKTLEALNLLETVGPLTLEQAKLKKEMELGLELAQEKKLDEQKVKQIKATTGPDAWKAREISAAKEFGKLLPKAKGADLQLAEVSKNIVDLMADPNLKAITGTFKGQDPVIFFTTLFRDGPAEAQRRITQLKGALRAIAVAGLRGTGNVTEAEGMAASNALARVGQATSYESMVAGLKEALQVIGTRRIIAMENINTPFPSATDPASHAKVKKGEWFTTTDPATGNKVLLRKK